MTELNETEIERARIVAIVLARHEAIKAAKKIEMERPATPKKLTNKEKREIYNK